MKPILVLYTPPIDMIDKDHEGKSEFDHLEDVMKKFSDEYRVLVFQHVDIPLPKVELHSIKDDVSDLDINELEEKIKATLKLTTN
jgi:hypothetical protein